MKAELTYAAFQCQGETLGFRGPRNFRLGVHCIVVDRESLRSPVQKSKKKTGLTHLVSRAFLKLSERKERLQKSSQVF